MWLVMGDADDFPAIWAYQGLRARGLEPLEFVSSEILAYSLRWEHRLKGNDTSIRIRLADNRDIQGNHICGVLNRLLSIPQKHLQAASPKDREYALQELASFFMSWLNCLDCPVFNPPTPHGLSGHLRHASEWAFLASRVGLPTTKFKQTSYETNPEMHNGGRLVPLSNPVQTVIILNGYPTGAILPPEILSGCMKLAALAKTPLLGIHFVPDLTGGWMFAGATPFPDLRLGGENFLDHFTTELRSKRKD